MVTQRVTMVLFYKYVPLFSQLFFTYLDQERKGGVVQLVERMLCTHEAIGSSPIVSNCFSLFLKLFLFVFDW